ncbi:MAG: copper chaperone PCu(A)C, partial [Mesorhizobium sp.]
LMFVGLKRQPKQGETFPATLTFEKAGSVTVEFAVEGMGGGMDDHAE